MIHVRFLENATDDTESARLSRVLAGTATDDDLAAITPTPALTEAPRPGVQVRDPRTMPGWRPGYAPGRGGAA